MEVIQHFGNLVNSFQCAFDLYISKMNIIEQSNFYRFFVRAPDYMIMRLLISSRLTNLKNFLDFCDKLNFFE